MEEESPSEEKPIKKPEPPTYQVGSKRWGAVEAKVDLGRQLEEIGQSVPAVPENNALERAKRYATPYQGPDAGAILDEKLGRFGGTPEETEVILDRAMHRSQGKEAGEILDRKIAHYKKPGANQPARGPNSHKAKIVA